jgi:hypothetical protein
LERILNGMAVQRRSMPVAQCPIRPGEPCTLCQLDVTGPPDCGLVYLAMSDPELRAGIRPPRRPAKTATAGREGPL